MSLRASSSSALARSAWWSAAARAHESIRDDRLFADPWAAVLAGRDGLDAYDRVIAERGRSVGDLHAVTTRFFDDFLSTAVHTHAIRQVVLVAAGLDARPFRLAWPADTGVFELEQPAVLAYKDEKFSLVGATAPCRRRAVGVDLRGDWAASLREAAFDPRERSAWLLEGFLYFLPERAAVQLLETISALAAPASVLGVDVVNRDMLTSPATRCWADTMAANGAPWLFTLDDPERLLTQLGWTPAVVEPGEREADFGRYPYPLTRRSVAGIPRSFLVTAARPTREAR